MRHAQKHLEAVWLSVAAQEWSQYYPTLSLLTWACLLVLKHVAWLLPLPDPRKVKVYTKEPAAHSLEEGASGSAPCQNLLLCRLHPSPGHQAALGARPSGSLLGPSLTLFGTKAGAASLLQLAPAF